MDSESFFFGLTYGIGATLALVGTIWFFADNRLTTDIKDGVCKIMGTELRERPEIKRLNGTLLKQEPILQTEVLCPEKTYWREPQ